MAKLGKFLNVPKEYWEEVDQWEIQANSNHNSGMDYNYYVFIPDNTSEELLDEMNWSIGECIDDIPVWYDN